MILICVPGADQSDVGCGNCGWALAVARGPWGGGDPGEPWARACWGAWEGGVGGVGWSCLDHRRRCASRISCHLNFPLLPGPNADFYFVFTL